MTLIRKNVGKIRRYAIFDYAQIRLATQQHFHWSYRFAFARDDQIEVTEIGVHVEGEAVRRDPARDVNADRRDLAAPSVNASQALDPKRFDAEVWQRAYQDLFQVAHVTMHVFTVRAEIDDRITDDLTQPVISYFPAAIRFKQGDVSLFELFFVEQDRRTVAAAADRQRVRVLEQQQRVGLRPVLYWLFGLFL